MASKENSSPPRYVLPDILGFDQLITGIGNDEAQKNAAEGVFAKENVIDGRDSSGFEIRQPKESLTTGLPFGSTLLISGPPGAGKTTFALELARGLMRFPPVFETQDDGVERGKSGEAKVPLIFYISPEIDAKRLKSMFAGMGWFRGDRQGLFRMDTASPDSDTLYVVVPQPEVDRPVPLPEELVNSIFNQIGKAISPSDAPREPRPVVVIVDSVTSLLKGCQNESEERRQTHEILHRLRALFGNDYLALTILLAEQRANLEMNMQSASVEDYLAEIVFRLSLKAAPLGRRLRALEIVKSQGVNMILGEHSWAIVTDKLVDTIFRHHRYQKAVREIATRSEESKTNVPWGTIAIFPRPTLLNRRLDIAREAESSLWSGTPGLDAMLKGNLQYWIRRPGAVDRTNGKPSLRPGSVTLIAGPIGVGKTALCVQFLLEDARKTFNDAALLNGWWEINWDSLLRPQRAAVFVTFDQGAESSTLEAWNRWIWPVFEKLAPKNEAETYPNLEGLLSELGKVIKSDSMELDAELMNLGVAYLGKEIAGALGNELESEWVRFLNVIKNETASEKFRALVVEALNGMLAMAWKLLLHGALRVKFRTLIFRRWISVLDFTQSHFDYNALTAHVVWALQWWKPNRIAFDGLSEWQTAFSRQEAAKMLEGLLVTLPKYRNEIDGSPTVFLSYELPITDDPLSPQALGVTANNIIVVRQINLNDQIRRIAYVLKADTDAQDFNVREMHRDSLTGRLDIRTGLDVFTDLLRGTPRPAEVVLQLFQENFPQRVFNTWLIKRLRRMHMLKFNLIDFSRSEIGSTLEDTDSETRFPPSDLKIQSVDEWWLSLEREHSKRENGIEQAVSVSPLMNLHDLWHPLDNEQWDPVPPTWKAFWVFEIEKAGPLNAGTPTENPNIYAVPAYTDFGMLCANVQRLLEAYDGVKRLEERDPLRITFEKFIAGEDDQLDTLLGGLDAGKVGEMHQGGNLLSEIHSAIIERTPPVWCKTDGEWFGGSPNEVDGTFVGLGRVYRDLMRTLSQKKVRELGSHQKWFFSFDTATRETAVCVFFEFAWAFGADEDFLRILAEQNRNSRSVTNRQAAEQALRFLSFLVVEGLMPAHANVESSRESLFSRHYYSTFQAVVDTYAEEKDARLVGVEEGQELRVDDLASLTSWEKRASFGSVPLLSLPFFPAGSLEHGGSYTQQLEVVSLRFKQLWDRAYKSVDKSGGFSAAARFLRESMPEEDVTPNQCNVSSLCKRTSLLWTALTRVTQDEHESRTAETDPKHQIPPNPSEFARSADTADLIHLFRRHLLRMRFLLGAPDEQSLRKVLKRDFEQGFQISDSEFSDSAGKSCRPAGYCCVGSWLYGVHRATRSPSLAYDLLREITSSEVAEKRAQLGAGMPVRKDFYEVNGGKPVPQMPYFDWNQLLLYCGSRARRRERVLPPKVNPARIYTVIHEEILKCLTVASLKRVWPPENTSIEERKKVVSDLSVAATNAIASIVSAVVTN